jgi:hypothetical protein
MSRSRKNACGSVASVVASAGMVFIRGTSFGKVREALTSQAQELTNRRDVPVCVSDAGVAVIRGQEIDHVIDALLLLITAQESAAEERVP